MSQAQKAGAAAAGMTALAQPLQQVQASSSDGSSCDNSAPVSSPSELLYKELQFDLVGHTGCWPTLQCRGLSLSVAGGARVGL